MTVGQDFESPPTGPPIAPPEAATPLRALPTRIGNYHIKRLLGLGGMGAVYEAVQEQPHRIVALKVMKRGVTSASALRRFEYEAQLLARLRHPGIAQVYEAGTHREGGDRVPYFAMEYIPGARHLTRYAQEKKLGTRQRLELFAKVCEAVEHGHQRGIVHRDLKPGNILVDGGGQPKIIDFGVARATDSDLFVTTLQTGLGEMIGTLPYMSPEQCAGDPHDLDARSDVYSLGVVLYELLTERLPYDVTKVAILEAARRIREQPPAKPSTINRTLRGDVETIALKALEKERVRRYSSAAGLGEDVRHYLQGEPIDARRDSAAYVAWTLMKSKVAHHPVLTFLLAGCLATGIAHTQLVPLLFRHWIWPVHSFERLLARSIPIPARAPGMENIRLIAIRDGVDYDALAAREGLAGVSAANWSSMRRVHGRLLEKLARAGARTVALDVMFRAPSPYDADLARGVAAVNAAGGAVVIAVPNWRTDEFGLPIQSDSEPGLSPEVGAAPGLRWGSATIGAGEFVAPGLILQRQPSPPSASFAAETYAAWRFPAAEPHFSMDTDADALRVIYTLRHAAVPRAQKLIGGPDVIPIPSLTGRPVPAPGSGIGPGDQVGYYPVLVPEAAAFTPFTRGYDEVFAAPEARLREWYADKLVLVGDQRAGKDEHVIPGGRTAFGMHLQTTTIGNILSGGGFRIPHERESLALTALASTAGLGVVVLSRRRWVWGTVTATILILGSLAVGVALFRVAHIMVNPVVPVASMLLGMLFGIGLSLMRAQTVAVN